jgi:ABC-type nitrate/sulfonate/bicarbonate transport system substrate-binding protein
MATLPLAAGPILYGEEFGIRDFTLDSIIAFDSNNTLAQAALSGAVTFHGGSTFGHLALIEAGQPFKMFGSYGNSTDYCIIGRDGVSTVEDLQRDDIRVANDNLGGLAHAIFDGMLEGLGAGFHITDVPGHVEIGSHSGRVAAFAADEVQATLVHLPYAVQLQEQVPDAVIIAKEWENVHGGFVGSCRIAPTAWLEEQADLATAICASTIRAAREFAASYEAFYDAAVQIIEDPAGRLPDQARELWEAAKDAPNWWPIGPDGGMAPENFEKMIALAKERGIVTSDLTFEDVVDPGPTERALELLGA